MTDTTPPARYWLVWSDDTPFWPESPLSHDEAVKLFLAEIASDDEAKVEIRQCSPRELEWAGIGTADESEED